MKTFWVYLFILMQGFSAFSEVRTWNDKQGNTYEGEYVRELFDKLTLKTTDGQEVRIAVEDFSEHDQKYLRVMVPPRLELDFTKKTSVKPKAPEMGDLDNDEVTILAGKATVTKDSKRPFTSGLKAEIFLFGEEVVESKYKILLSRTEKNFLLPKKRGDTVEVKTEPIELQVYTEYDDITRRGPVYIGYLIAIMDRQGNTVHMKTNITWLQGEGKVEQIQALYRQGAQSVYSRYFDKKTLQKVPVPRISPSFKRN